MEYPHNTSSWSGLPETEPIEIAEVIVEVYRAPISRPVRTSFGVMTTRPAVLIRVREPDGVVGYGEAWCNFPEPAAEYRAKIVGDLLAPKLVDRTWPHPRAIFDHLSATTRIVALQAGEKGPFSHAIAGLDIAVWDMAARRAGHPLHRFLRPGAQDRLHVYASGIGPEAVMEQVLEARSTGHRAFKLKVGFNRDHDLANLAEVRRRLGPDTLIAVDANQAWTADEAVLRRREMAPFHPAWIEEPIGADHNPDDWLRVAEATDVPLAAGENVYGADGFDRMIKRTPVKIIQPDATKWGGISGCMPVAARIIASGRRYFPHYLGGGIGLLASAHLLAAAGGDGLLEVDCNSNPLREGLATPFPLPAHGQLTLGDQPGLGVEPTRSISGLITERIVKKRGDQPTLISPDSSCLRHTEPEKVTSSAASWGGPCLPSGERYHPGQ